MAHAYWKITEPGSCQARTCNGLFSGKVMLDSCYMYRLLAIVIVGS